MNIVTEVFSYFVLFFAAIDIGVIILDHSYDEEKKKKYEQQKVEDDYRNKIKSGNYVV